MKKKLILFIILFIQITAVFAAGTSVSEIENTIFGYNYDNETDIKRVERIESYLYGTKKSGNVQKRIENIKNDIGYVKQQEKISKTQENLKSELKNDLMNLKEDSSVEYPIVDRIENELFKTTYKTEDIYKRLNRLEQKVFQKTSSEPLTNRVDKLANVVLPKKKIQRGEENYSQQELDNYYRANGLEPIDSQAIPFQLAVLEQDLLKNNYDNDNTANRLNRLEQKLFNRTFSTDSDINRMQRIMVAYDAKQKSYKYENNRKMQNMATASQIGGILLMILAMIL